MRHLPFVLFVAGVASSAFAVRPPPGKKKLKPAGVTALSAPHAATSPAKRKDDPFWDLRRLMAPLLDDERNAMLPMNRAVSLGAAKVALRRAEEHTVRAEDYQALAASEAATRAARGEPALAPEAHLAALRATQAQRLASLNEELAVNRTYRAKGDASESKVAALDADAKLLREQIRAEGVRRLLQ